MNIDDLINKLETYKNIHGNIEVVSQNSIGEIVDLRITAFPLLDEDNNERDWMLLLIPD